MIAVSVAVALGVTVSIGTARAADENRHVIKVKLDHAVDPGEWTATGQLYAGDGTEVHNWREYHDGWNHVRWEFTDGGDGGWFNMNILFDGVYFPIEGQPLNQNHCFFISEGDDGSLGITREEHCPFDDEAWTA